MTFYKSNGDRVPDHILAMAEDAKAGKMDRREFLALASVFGASTAMAYGLLGLADPTSAKAEDVQGKKGGTLKVAQWIKDPKDPPNPTGRKSPMPSARRSSRWSSTQPNTHSVPICWKPGT